MTVGQDVFDARPHDSLDPASSDGGVALLERPVPPSTAPAGAEPARWKRAARQLAFPTAVFAATRAALMLIAVACDAAFPRTQRGPNSLSAELGNWDGRWYLRIARIGYLGHVSHYQTTLGFLPLYPMSIWFVSHVFRTSLVAAGMLVSGAGGLVATVLVQRLVTRWWGPAVARKAVVAFCLFPGTIIFSMVYSEGLLIPLVAGSMLAIANRRWWLAGTLAALATAVAADAVSVVVMCAAAFAVELYRRGWQDPETRRSLTALVLSPVGAIAFAVFLWFWTGSPFASYIAQKDGWHESTNPLAIPHQFAVMIGDIGWHLDFARINLNIPVGLIGFVFLLYALRHLWRERRVLPVEVLAFTAAMSFLVCTSWEVPPNPRMLITAFPLVVVFAKTLEGKSWRYFCWANGGLFVLLSALTYTGGLLRP